MAKSVRVIAERTLANERFRLTRTRAEIEEADGARRVARSRDLPSRPRRGGAALRPGAPRRDAGQAVPPRRLSRRRNAGDARGLRRHARRRRSRDLRAARSVGGDRRARSRRRAMPSTPSPAPARSPRRSAVSSPLTAPPTASAPAAASTPTNISMSSRSDTRQAEAMIASGAIRDAKTIALIYYAKATGLFG